MMRQALEVLGRPRATDLGPQAGLPSFPPSTSETALAALTLKTRSPCVDETNERQKARPSLSHQTVEEGWRRTARVVPAFAKAQDTQEGKILVNDGNSRTPRRRQEPHRLKAKYFLLLLREVQRL